MPDVKLLFYFISHSIQIWIFPPGFNILLISVGLILIHTKSMVLGTSLIIGACMLLWILSMPVSAMFLINYLQRQYPIIKSISNSSNGAIIILAGGTQIAPEFKHKPMTNEATLLRLRYAVHLHNQNTQLKLITSGGRLDYKHASAANIMMNDLRDYFHKSTKLIENKSINTRDEAKYMLPILRAHQIKWAYIVTNAWHMPRTMYIFKFYFRHTNIHLIAAPTGFYTLNTSGIMKYLPSIHDLAISVTALHEYVGLLSYKLHMGVCKRK